MTSDADQPDRHVALRVLGFLGRGRDRVEADIGEEDRRRGADHADRCPSRCGMNGMEVLRP